MESLRRVRTTRFVAERLRPEDLVEWKRLHSDSIVMATLGGLMADEETERRFQIAREHWETHGFGIWSFRDPSSGAYVARGGLRRSTLDGIDQIELLYAVRPEWWNQGVATEVGRLALDVAFKQLGRAEVACFTLPTNLKSQRVMQKLGFVYVRDGVYAGLPHVFFRVRLDEAT